MITPSCLTTWLSTCPCLRAVSQSSDPGSARPHSKVTYQAGSHHRLAVTLSITSAGEILTRHIFPIFVFWDWNIYLSCGPYQPCHENSSHFFLNESLCIYFLSEYSEFGGGHENVVRTLVSCQPGCGHVVRVFSVKVSGAGACGLLVVVTERAGLAVSQLTSSCQGWNDPDWPSHHWRGTSHCCCLHCSLSPDSFPRWPLSPDTWHLSPDTWQSLLRLPADVPDCRAQLSDSTLSSLSTPW